MHANRNKKAVKRVERGMMKANRMPEEEQRECLDEIEMNIDILLNYLENNQKLKERAEDVPATGMAVLRQQITLAQAIKTWIADLKKTLF